MEKNSLSCSRVSARLVVYQIVELHTAPLQGGVQPPLTFYSLSFYKWEWMGSQVTTTGKNQPQQWHSHTSFKAFLHCST